ncbi:unnamed protein product [Musa acuminata subsp. malaccensis]|uniref:Uncharacterized protein n=1 Tax=Musa acuminata subsp. malaccensis TaxID=214687 RepID=A0A804U5L5_MUSAM|nr:unnamed protein product [Musa acuminata subsp. malaccensis]
MRGVILVIIAYAGRYLGILIYLSRPNKEYFALGETSVMLCSC